MSEALNAAEGGLRKYKSYPAYRNSGVEWLGEIPEHWAIKRLKFAATTIMGQSPSSDDYTFDEDETPFLQGNAEFGTQYPIARYFCNTANKIVPTGSILISVRAPVGALNIADRDYGIGRGLCAIVPDSCDLLPEFAWHLLTVTRDELLSIATGSTYEAVAADEVEAMIIILPLLNEQSAIASFLDRETSKIDALIEKKERLIELLQEKRSALITHAVTKGLPAAAAAQAGLDLTVPMKDSGMEWLGEIPEHWDVKKLKHMSSVQFSSVDKKSYEGEIPVRLCNYVDVYYNDFILPDLNFMEATASPSEISKFILRKGDVIITKDSESWDDIAISAYVPSDFEGVLCGYHLAQIHSNNAVIDGEYLFRSFSAQGINDQFKVAANGITRYGLGKYWLDNSFFPTPPTDEQYGITKFLDLETAKIDALIEKICQAIECLKEYRTALISAAVTGKIDVREKTI